MEFSIKDFFIFCAVESGKRGKRHILSIVNKDKKVTTIKNLSKTVATTEQCKSA